VTTVLDPPLGRAVRWRLLSLGFVRPTSDTRDEIGALAEALLEVEPTPEIEAVLAAARSAEPEELEAEYQSLFGGTVAVAPYEGSYEPDPIRQSREMADIAGFYRVFGAEAHGPAAERPDHVGCELEFLSYLELRRLAAAGDGDEDGAQLVSEIGATFLEDHARHWLPAFFEEVRAATPQGSVLHALAALGASCLTDELERRGISPTPQKRRHALGAVERDSFACAASTPAPAGS
jgi:TorA maturation chaperone TorD